MSGKPHFLRLRARPLTVSLGEDAEGRRLHWFDLFGNVDFEDEGQTFRMSLLYEPTVESISLQVETAFQPNLITDHVEKGFTLGQCKRIVSLTQDEARAAGIADQHTPLRCYGGWDLNDIGWWALDNRLIEHTSVDLRWKVTPREGGGREWFAWLAHLASVDKPKLVFQVPVSKMLGVQLGESEIDLPSLYLEHLSQHGAARALESMSVQLGVSGDELVERIGFGVFSPRGGPPGIVAGQSLGALLSQVIETEEGERDAVIRRIAEAAEITEEELTDIVTGAVLCPPLVQLERIAEATGQSVERFKEVAREDGCDYDAPAAEVETMTPEEMMAKFEEMFKALADRVAALEGGEGDGNDEDPPAGVSAGEGDGETETERENARLKARVAALEAKEAVSAAESYVARLGEKGLAVPKDRRDDLLKLHRGESTIPEIMGLVESLLPKAQQNSLGGRIGGRGAGVQLGERPVSSLTPDEKKLAVREFQKAQGIESYTEAYTKFDQMAHERGY